MIHYEMLQRALKTQRGDMCGTWQDRERENGDTKGH